MSLKKREAIPSVRESCRSKWQADAGFLPTCTRCATLTGACIRRALTRIRESLLVDLEFWRRYASNVHIPGVA